MRIGIDLGGSKIEGIALADDGRELARRRVATPRHDYDATIGAIAALVGDLERETGAHGSVGVGMPGALSPVSGLVKNANSTWLIGRPIDRDLAQALGRPVRCANDANCFALSEATDGAGAGAGVVFGVIVGTGTGAGIVAFGRVLTGPNAIAGEWGHNPLPWPRDDERPGPVCYCGKTGCLETYLSGPGLTRDYRDSGGAAAAEPDGPEARGIAAGAPEVVRRAERGEAEAEAALARYEDRMARGLAVVLNLLDPDVIVLGGGMSQVARLYENVPRLWQAWAFSDRISTPLRPPRHGDASGVRGAAWLWSR
jgi:fructokinase